MQALIVDKSKYCFCRLVASAVGNQYTFDVQSAQDIAQANIKVYAIEAISAAEAPTDVYGNTIVAAAGAPSLLVTLVDTRGNILLENFPFQRMRTSQNNGFPVYVKDFEIDLTKSFVTIANTTSVSANNVAGFNLYYTMK
jgi:hypothetical protein